MISEDDARWQISQTLKERGFRHVGPGPDQYRGPIMAAHKKVEVEINIRDLHFTELPHIHFLNRESLPSILIAHLEEGTGLCFANRQLLRLDPTQPGASMLRVLEEAEKTISRSLNKRAAPEITLEYPRYWGGLQIYTQFLASMRSNNAHLFQRPDKQAFILAKSRDALPTGYSCGRKVRIFRCNAELKPAKNFSVPKSYAELQEWMLFQSFDEDGVARQVVEALAANILVFFQAENGWVGCELKLKGTLKVLSNKKAARSGRLIKLIEDSASTIELDRYCGSPADIDYVTSRNIQDSETPLRGKKIALIGCGTIGGYLARFLVQSGAGNDGELFLVDSETLSPGNIGRHLLNFEDFGLDKAEAVKAEIQRFHPSVVLRAKRVDALKIWDEFFNFDLIIDATGVEIVSEELNRRALLRRQISRSCALLHTWLFGNGIAAQSFLNDGDGFACYRCLRPELDRPWLNDPRKEVASIGDITVAACGDGPYVPYSVDAPAIAASLALQAVLDYFSGTPRARLRTRIIDYQKANHIDDKSPKPHTRCPVCN
jgi:molybdopterin/thiamine biosynthesis adenylyltransferase